jgi:hypothetical protein
MPKAHAGYAQVAPPTGWAAGGGSTYGTVTGRLAAAAASNGSSYWTSSTVINAGGRAITVPAAGRFAANAGKYAARGLMVNPLAIGVAGAAWLASECVSYNNGWELTCGGTPPKPSDGYVYSLSGLNSATYNRPTREEACSDLAEMSEAVAHGVGNSEVSSVYVDLNTCRISYKDRWDGRTYKYDAGFNPRPADCPAGWYVTPAGCVSTPPPQKLTPEDVENKMAPKTIPPEVFPNIPNTPIPIGPPSVNPSSPPDIAPQPFHVPNGTPSAVPNSNPQTWDHPIITVTPAPTVDDPWRVVTTPRTVRRNTPAPLTDPVTGDIPGADPLAPIDPSNPPTDPTEEPDTSSPTDSALPDLPKLYEPKYKEGLEGVWKEQKERLKSTSLSQLTESLMPKITGGGSCPAWQVNLDFAGWASYGSKNVAPPCEVWEWGRMIILVSALLLARALIFGG